MAHAHPDPDVAALLARAAGDEPLRGTFFLNDAREMLRATREIERAAAESHATLFVGFQDAERLDDEADVYRDLVTRADVTAFGVGEPRHDIDGLTWVSVPRDRHALDNQWFLVLTGKEPLAFVGYETSAARAFRQGPSYNEERSWEGFTTGDERLVGFLRQRLEQARDVAQQRPERWYLAATYEDDPRYQAVQDAAMAAAKRDGAGLILYDRTTESYLTNPYPSGPWSDEHDALSPGWSLTPAALDAIGRGYLARQLRVAADAGIAATAHLALDTGAKAMREVLARFEPAMVFLPAHLGEPSLFDRVRGNTLAALTSVIDVPVQLVDDHGDLTEHPSG